MTDSNEGKQAPEIFEPDNNVEQEFPDTEQLREKLEHGVKDQYDGDSDKIRNESRDVMPETDIEYDIRMNKYLRMMLDDQLQELKRLKGSRERSLAIIKLQESIMWLGMDLKRLGGPNPYPNSKNPANTIIDPTADNLKL